MTRKPPATPAAPIAIGVVRAPAKPATRKGPVAASVDAAAADGKAAPAATAWDEASVEAEQAPEQEARTAPPSPPAPEHVSPTAEPTATSAAENSPTLAEQIADLSAVVAGLSHELASLRQRVETISTFERLRDVVLSQHTTQPYRAPSSSRIEARDFMELTDGLYFLEYAPSGVAYRWTGPGHFTRFRFNVDRSVPVRVQLNLFSLGKISSADVLTADIDGVVYPFRQTSNIDELVTDPVPPRPGERQTDVLLHVPVLFTPEGGSGDTRRLGVAVTGIVLEPAT